jgi:hypothetical protein
MLLFDTGKKLEKAVGEEAAHIIVEALEKLSEEQKKDAATKGDLRETELRLQREIETVRKEMREVELRLQKAVDATHYGLLRWQLGVGLALAVIMAKGFGWLGF